MRTFAKKLLSGAYRYALLAAPMLLLLLSAG
jgi:hypothetical protein